ncbi:hypothetical protein N7481_011959 [Penicillium waksmanii]|uniref:uncharacterized protein n=1 Tax=Penicillium waksmanii TaxID=69791 RepID=UPI0025483A7D|nr:uncharacterized protein N7481_011959 [Penicillium waksmanii]KAJ5965245.1 hypothetical protein N7481_011959 [Penicillium waksmanii]
MTRQLLWWERVDAFVGWLFVAAAGLMYAAIAGPFRGRSGASNYHHHLIQAAVKKVLYRTVDTLRQG